MIRELSREEFDYRVKSFPNTTFYQTSNWADLKKYTSWEALYLGYYEENMLEGMGLFLLRKIPAMKYYLAYSPRGYLINFFD